MTTINCKGCGVKFKTKHRQQLHCTVECGERFHVRTYYHTPEAKAKRRARLERRRMETKKAA